MFATFHVSGSFPSANDFLKSMLIGFVNTLAISFINFGCNSSGPGDFVSFKCSNSFCTTVSSMLISLIPYLSYRKNWYGFAVFTCKYTSKITCLATQPFICFQNEFLRFPLWCIV